MSDAQTTCDWKALIKVFFKALVPLLIVVSLFFIWFSYRDYSSNRDSITSAVKDILSNETELVQDVLRINASNVKFLRDIIEHKLSDKGILDDKKSEVVNHLLATFLIHNKSIHHIDFFNLTDNTLIKVGIDADKTNVENVVKLTAKLPPDLEYFKVIEQLKDRHSYISQFELLTKDDKVIIPFVPVIRFAATVFDKQNKRVGIVVINYDARGLFDHVRRSAQNMPGHLLLVNSDGYYIIGENPFDEWGNILLFREHRNMRNMFLSAWGEILAATGGEINNKQGVFLFSLIAKQRIGELTHDSLNLRLIWYISWKQLLFQFLLYRVMVYFFVVLLLLIISGLIAVVQTRRAVYLRELERRAITDQLTGLANRHRLIEMINTEILRAKRYQRKFCLIMLDIDHFKEINDTYGHIKGDEVLRCLSKICIHDFRGVDTIGRFGGEEFIVILPEIDLDNATVIAERLRESIDNNNACLHFTVSIGVIAWKEYEDTVEKVIKRVDDALYQAKNNGRNRVVAIP